MYDGIIKQCIHLFKYRGKLSLVKFLSGLLIDCAHSSINMHEIDLIVPVPLHKSKLRQRQFNQAELLAKALAKEFSKKLDIRTLIRKESRGAQASLSGNQRRRNVHNAFGIRNASHIKGKRILLVDDVFTTGSTVNECARMFVHSKAMSVDVISLARSR